MDRLRFHGFLAFAGLLASPVQADVVFADSTFNPSSYSQTATFTTPGSSISVSQCAGCGNPGPALQVTETISYQNSMTGYAEVGLLNNTFVYSPLTQGSIESISASVSKDLSTNYIITNGQLPFEDGWHPLLEQDGKYYIATISGPTFNGGTTGFLTLSQAGLTASDFVQFDFTSGSVIGGSPNFSGDPITFGIALIASTNGNVVFSGVDDNLSYDLVSASTPAQLAVAPNIVSFSTVANSSAPMQRTLSVQNSGGGNASFTAAVASGSPWLSLSTSTGTATVATPVPVILTVNPTGLGGGYYRDVIHFASAAGSVDVPVTLFVNNSGPILWARPAGILFTMVQGAGSSAMQNIIVSNQGSSGSTVNWTAAAATGPGIPNGNFLSFGSQNGQSQPGSPLTIPVSLNTNASTLAPGVYYELVQVSAAGVQDSPQYVTAVLNVLPASSSALPQASPAGLLFRGSPGQPIPSKQFTVNWSSSQAQLFYVAASTANGQPWLQVTPSSAYTSPSNPAVLTVSVNTAGLAAGVYTGSIQLDSGELGSVNVTLILGTGTGAAIRETVRPEAAAAVCSPAALVLTETGIPNSFSVPAGWPAVLTATMTDDCGNTIDGGSVTASFSNGDPPLDLSAQGSSGQYLASWQPSNLSNATITLKGVAGTLKPAISQLSGFVTPNAAPVLNPNGIVNDLSFLAGGALAPGTVAAAFGSGLTTSANGVSPGMTPLPTEFQNTQLLVGGFESPLYFLSQNQLNVQIPAELAALQQYPAVGVVNGALTLPVQVTVVPIAPGVAANADGRVIAQHSDFSLVGADSPAHPGESIVIYLAGMGATNPPVPSDTQAPGPPTLATAVVQPVVKVNGQTAQIEFAGLTPGGIGLYQINFVVPTGVPAGSLPLTVAQGTANANATTLPVAVP